MFGEAFVIAIALWVVEATASSASSWHDSSARQETEAHSKPTLSDVGSRPAILPTQCLFYQGFHHVPRSSHPFQDQVFPKNQLAFLISVPLSANKTHTYDAGIFQTHSSMTPWGNVLVIAPLVRVPLECSPHRVDMCAHSM